MTATKKPYAFRLSKQAVSSLIELHDKTGMNHTAIVEYAIVKLNNELNCKPIDNSNEAVS